MRINIKTVRHLKISDDIKLYAEKKLEKFEKRIPKDSFIEITFEDLQGERGGKNKLIHLEANLYSNPDIIFHLEEKTEDFKKSIDLIERKFREKLDKMLKQD